MTGGVLPAAARRLGTFPAVLCLALAGNANAAHAQGTHGMGGATLSAGEIVGAISHGISLACVVLLFGLMAFVALVWLPVGKGRLGVFVRGAWALAGLLAAAGLVELSLYAVRASGEPFGAGLLGQAVWDTRVGHVWLARLFFAFLAALVATWAAERAHWWAAAGLGSVSLMTLTQLSHAAAEGRLLPFLLDWTHVVAASVWMGGLLGFPLLLLGPLRETEARKELLSRSVRRFSTVASVAVAAVVVTGVYAALLHVQGLEDLLGSPYGRALIMKLGLVLFMFPIAAINLADRGKGPFDRMVGAELLLALGVFVATGFLTSQPPP